MDWLSVNLIKVVYIMVHRQVCLIWGSVNNKAKDIITGMNGLPERFRWILFMYAGTIKKVIFDRGFGFSTPEGGGEVVFFHFKL